MIWVYQEVAMPLVSPAIKNFSGTITSANISQNWRIVIGSLVSSKVPSEVSRLSSMVNTVLDRHLDKVCPDNPQELGQRWNPLQCPRSWCQRKCSQLLLNRTNSLHQKPMLQSCPDSRISAPLLEAGWHAASSFNRPQLIKKQGGFQKAHRQVDDSLRQTFLHKFIVSRPEGRRWPDLQLWKADKIT